MRVATFNLQNLRLRMQDGDPVLDGAADQDTPGQQRPKSLALADRVETAKVIARAAADIVGLQEVFDSATLDFFHDRFLVGAGSRAYPYRYCLKGNDGRGRDVAAMSRVQPVRVRSHARLTGRGLGLHDLSLDLRDQPIFRRDCLELEFDTVTLFVCHFKAPYPDAVRAFAIREAEARAVRKIIERRYPDPEQGHWIILGDFNEPAREGASSTAIEPLIGGFAFDLADRLEPDADWTYEVPDTHLHSRPDRILVSPRLAKEFPEARPQIIRSGMAPYRMDAESGSDGRQLSLPHASDHALLFADFPGL